MENTAYWYVPTISAQISIQIIMALVFTYLYFHDRKPFLILWGIGCYGWVLKLSMDLVIFFSQAMVSSLFFLQIGCLVGSFFLCWGSINFMGKKLPQLWVIWVWAVFIGSILSLVFFKSLTDLIMLAITLGVLFIYTWTGLAFLKAGNIEVIGQRLTGWSLILTGLHFANYPWLKDVEWIAPWGYLLAGALTFLISIGILLVYYQRIRTNLLESETRLQLLAENAQDLIYRYRLVPSPGFDYVSPASLAITGYSPDDFYAGLADKLQLVPPQENLNPDHSEGCAGKIVKTQPILCKDGREVWIEQRSTGVVNQSGQLIAIEGIARDVTQRMKIEEELRRMEESRIHLLTNISHDLRTPLATVQGYIKAMLDQVISEPSEQNQYLTLIYNRVLKIKQLIQDLFELAQLESRSFEFNLQRVAIDELMARLFGKYETDIDNAGLKYETEFPGPGGAGEKAVWAEIDAHQIERVFDNLIYNAIKHTPPGGVITVTYNQVPQNKRPDLNEMNREKDSELELLVQVKDTGAGISPEELPLIFDRYYKGGSTSAALRNSTGLGLSIAKEIIEYHNGRIWAESTVKKGSTFYFTLPLKN